MVRDGQIIACHMTNQDDINNNQLNNGQLVKIINREHIWYGEIGIVREVKTTGFRRIELLGITTWLPVHWLEPIDD